MATKNSSTTQRWKCTGTKENPHPEVENYGSKCSLPGCSVTGPASALPPNKGLGKGAITSIVAGIIVIVSAVGYGLYVLFKPCPLDYQKQGSICVPVNEVPPNIFRNPDRQ